MSSQTQIGTFTDGDEDRSADVRRWRPGDDSGRQCTNFNQYVHPDLANVYGDEDGRVHRCLGCATHRQLVEGAGAGKDVPEARSQSPSHGGGWSE